MQVGEAIYLDYQAATPIDPRVLGVMHDASATLFANPHAVDHALGWRAAAAITHAADQVGNLYGLQGDDVIFTSGASEANAMMFRAAKEFLDQTDQAEAQVGAADHSSILNEAQTSGLITGLISLDHRGAPDPRHLESSLTEKTAIVSVVGVNNENGAIADLRAISDVCARSGTLLHVDLSQSALAVDIDLLELGISFATVSAHKLYGPKGVGALLVGPGMADHVMPLILGAGQQGGRRGGTMPTELICGFGEACRLIEETKEVERVHVAAIRNKFVGLLERSNLATLVGGVECRHPGNALMRFPGCEASDLLARVQPKIAASTQSACSSGSIEPSHVLRAMGYDANFASECARFSFGRFSTDVQVVAAVKILEEAVRETPALVFN